jgi:hypothetical protein
MNGPDKKESKISEWTITWDGCWKDSAQAQVTWAIKNIVHLRFIQAECYLCLMGLQRRTNRYLDYFQTYYSQVKANLLKKLPVLAHSVCKVSADGILAGARHGNFFFSVNCSGVARSGRKKLLRRTRKSRFRPGLIFDDDEEPNADQAPFRHLPLNCERLQPFLGLWSAPLPHHVDEAESTGQNLQAGGDQECEALGQGGCQGFEQDVGSKASCPGGRRKSSRAGPRVLKRILRRR